MKLLSVLNIAVKVIFTALNLISMAQCGCNHLASCCCYAVAEVF